MNRGWLVLVAAILLALLLAPIVLLLLQSEAAAPGTSNRPSSAAASESQSAEAMPVDGDVLDPARMEWSFAMQGHDANGHPEPSYVLQAGNLAAADPLVDMRVPFATRGDLDLARHPAVSAPVAGAVVYATDDGARSEVRRVTIAPQPADALVLELEQIVWDLAIDPTGTTVYLAVVERHGADAGVLAVTLDGSVPPERIMEPVAGADDPGGIRLVAVVPFSVELNVALDGAHLQRMTCQVGRCASEVLDLATGELTDLGERQVVGVIGGLVVHSVCNLPVCRLAALDLATGQDEDLAPAERMVVLTLVEGDGVLIMEAELAFDGNAHAINVLDIATGDRDEVIRAPAGGGVSVASEGPVERLTLPGGVVLVDLLVGVESKRMAIDLVTGGAIEVPRPPSRPPPGIPQG